MDEKTEKAIDAGMERLRADQERRENAAREARAEAARKEAAERTASDLWYGRLRDVFMNAFTSIGERIDDKLVKFDLRPAEATGHRDGSRVMFQIKSQNVGSKTSITRHFDMSPDGTVTSSAAHRNRSGTLVVGAGSLTEVAAASALTADHVETILQQSLDAFIDLETA